jgi:hypothetical protein
MTTGIGIGTPPRPLGDIACRYCGRTVSRKTLNQRSCASDACVALRRKERAARRLAAKTHEGSTR